MMPETRRIFRRHLLSVTACIGLVAAAQTIEQQQAYASCGTFYNATGRVQYVSASDGLWGQKQDCSGSSNARSVTTDPYLSSYYYTCVGSPYGQSCTNFLNPAVDGVTNPSPVISYYANQTYGQGEISGQTVTDRKTSNY